MKRFAPSLANDTAAIKLWAKGERLIASPSAYQAMIECNGLIDVRAILPQLRLPVLVLHDEADVAVPVANGRYLAAHIPGARYIEYPAGDHRPWAEGNAEALCGDVEEFVTGHRARSSYRKQSAFSPQSFSPTLSARRSNLRASATLRGDICLMSMTRRRIGWSSSIAAA
jgi:hypothetical protein